MSADPLVVEVVRSGVCESVHLLDVVVVDGAGNVVASAGDPSCPAAFRSSAKPIQARASIRSGWVPVDDSALAIACASHGGEPAHVAAVRAILTAAGLPEAALACPPDVPVDPAAALAVSARAAIYHNCSGKHAAMLAASIAAGWSPERYLEPDHPVQQAVRELVAELFGTRPRELVDGCGAPTVVAELAVLARAFLRLDGGPEAAAMRAHPFLIGGTRRVDTDVMTAVPALLVKSGAEGLTCVAGPGIGIALKARDGAARPRGPALLYVLNALGLIDQSQTEALFEHGTGPVLGGGHPVGRARVRGRLSGSGIR
ncbi:MAG: asparaginase [Actinomycetota bacterium]